MPDENQVSVKEYNIEFGKLLSEAAGKLDGAKWPIIASLITVYLVQLLLASIAGQMPVLWMSLLVQVLAIIPVAPLAAGLAMQGVRRAVDLPVTYKMLFSYYRYTVPLTIYYLVFVGIGLLIEPVRIYLGQYGVVAMVLILIAFMILFSMSVLLIVDKGVGILTALKSSASAVYQHWFKVILFMILVYALIILGIVTLIGWIWLIPLEVIAFGILYRDMFGVSTTQ